MSCVVASRIKEMIKKQGCNTAGDVMGAIDKMVDMEVMKACKRAKSNGRKTCRAADL